MRRFALAAEGKRLEHALAVRRENRDGAIAIGLSAKEFVNRIRGNIRAAENMLDDFLDAVVQFEGLRLARLESLDEPLEAEML